MTSSYPPILVTRAQRARSYVLASCFTVLALQPFDRVHAEPSASERETARALMDEGDQRRAAGDLYGARERFEAAHAIMNVSTTALELARTQAATGQLVEARATAIAAANMPAQRGESAVYAKARAQAAALATELAPRVPDVTVSSEPETLTGRLTIDGMEVPRPAHAVPFKLNPGSHVISLEVPGYQPSTQPFSLTEREHAQITLQLLPETKPLAPNTVAAQAPAPASPETSAPVGAVASYPAARTRGFVAIALGGAVLAAGMTTGIVAAVNAGDIRERCDGNSCPTSLRDRLSVANTLANLSNVLLPVGALGLGYGLFEVLTHPYEEPHPRVGVQVALDMARPGLVVRGAL